VQELHGHTRAVLSLATMDLTLATGGSDSQILLWDMRHGLVRSQAEDQGVSSPKLNIVGGFSSIARVKLGAGAIYSMKILCSKQQASENCVSVFAGCQDTSVYRVDVSLTSATGASVVGLVRFGGACGFIYSVALNVSDPPSLYAGAGDGIIRVWDADAPSSTSACVERHEIAGKRSSTARDVVKMPGILSTEATCKVFDCKGLELTPILPGRHLIAMVQEDALLTANATRAHDAEQTGWSDEAGQANAVQGGETLPGLCGSVYALAMHGSDLYSG
jgi:WD40 repeat protein